MTLDLDIRPKYHYDPVDLNNDVDRRITFDDLSEEQKRAHDDVMLRIDSEEMEISLGGVAGSGKSTLIPLISNTVGDTSTTAFCAFTGKAANVLQRKLSAAGITNPGYVGTIHRLMYYPITDAVGRIIGWQQRDFPLTVGGTEEDGGTRIDRIIIDEASMLNQEILTDLEFYDLSILLVGDHKQLKPVQGKSVLEQPSVCLEEIHRQAADNPIIQLSTEIRHGGKLPRDFPESDKIQFVRRQEVFEIIGETYERLGLDMAVLVRSNRLRKHLNVEPRDTPEPVVGDKVICLKNAAPVYNGMRGILEEVAPYQEHWYKGRVNFPEDGLAVEGLMNRYQFGRDRTLGTPFDLQRDGIKYPRNTELGLLFDFGVALTVHKAQGSAFKEVILFNEEYGFDDEDPEGYTRWLYTAVTRASDKITIVR